MSDYCVCVSPHRAKGPGPHVLLHTKVRLIHRQSPPLVYRATTSSHAWPSRSPGPARRYPSWKHSRATESRSRGRRRDRCWKHGGLRWGQEGCRMGRWWGWRVSERFVPKHKVNPGSLTCLLPAGCRAGWGVCLILPAWTEGEGTPRSSSPSFAGAAASAAARTVHIEW
jgi:hypothetical protein